MLYQEGFFNEQDDKDIIVTDKIRRNFDQAIIIGGNAQKKAIFKIEKTQDDNKEILVLKNIYKTQQENLLDYTKTGYFCDTAINFKN